jgi:hypothetical protein
VATPNVELINNKPGLERQNAFVRKPGTILYPAELPELPENLKTAFESQNLSKDRALQLALTRVMGTHLRNTVGTKPSKSDYEHFSRSVVEKYEFLGDNSNHPNVSLQEYASLFNSLSAC